MALTDESNGNGFYMPVAPAYTSGGGCGNGNGFGGDWAWIILLLLLGWGNNSNGFGGGYAGGGTGSLYPWMNQATLTSDGFQNQLMNDNITSIREGIFDLSTQLCNCCADVQMSLANGFAGVENGANARQMANMQQMFGLQSALQDCCCENRAGIADLKYTIATENCADRQALNEGVRDIIASQTAGTQRILDQMCKDKIDEKNDTIAQLRQEILYSKGQASQVAQNSTIINGIYDRLSTCPVGTVPVYGEQPIFTCQSNNNCGCGCGNNF